MWLKSLAVTNFRAIESITTPFDERANVIVGPNAIGKTTLLEAIRLAKAALAPRASDEMQQAFISLGALTPHNPSQLNFPALARDPTRPVRIVAIFQLTQSEIQSLDTLGPQIASELVRAQLGPAASTQGPLGLVQYLSSPVGQAALAQASSLLSAELPRLKAGSTIALDLLIEPTGIIRGAKLLDQVVFTAMETGLPPHQALFSYFPADRALPTGEVAIQVGGPDIAAQLQAHNSVPQNKFHRLKTTVVNNFVASPERRDKMTRDFESIFSKVLKDRSLTGIRVNKFGLVSVGIKETSTNRTFDMDAMSSGEKGLILTFLLISHSICDNGMIMLDEPELHLNPAVCKTILPFMIDEYLTPKNVQAIVCSHSPEILGSAFDAPKCSLLHLQAPSVISKIYAEDRREVFEALRRLGTSASDVLFSAGSIFVEGEHDLEILQAGFSEIIIRYHIAQLGGREAVEREIKALQDAEKRDEIDTLKCFIFDLDNAPTALQSTRFVKVLQWRRRCLENYLIDEKIIYDLLNDQGISRDRIDQRGQVLTILRDIALGQLRELAAKSVYDRMGYENPGLRPKEIAGKDYHEIADVLLNRLAQIRSQVSALAPHDWKREFIRQCEEEHKNHFLLWETEWLIHCDGKRLFRDLHSAYGIKVSPVKFKKMIIERMERDRSDQWAVIQQMLTDALRVS